MVRIGVMTLALLALPVGVVRAQPYVAQPTPDALILMPWPRRLALEEGKYRLTTEFSVSVAGRPAPRLHDGATRFLGRLQELTGLFLRQARVTAEDAGPGAALGIQVARPGAVRLGEDESYALRVTPRGITLRAETDLGALHGLQTLLQLVLADDRGYYLPAARIEDAPRFPWRGLLIDVARHFMPLEVITRNLDAMAAVKLNVLHLHLTDDQGFRVESKTFPKLHQEGSDGEYFTHEQIRAIVRYAEARGIRVVPEFDLPGHATSWFVGYPEHASAPGPYRIEDYFGIFDPVFDPTREETYEFLDKFFGEMAALFPDEYVHVGGDENTGVHWRRNPRIRAFMETHGLKTTEELQARFTTRVARILEGHGKKTVGWEEILAPGLPRSAVIQSWRGRESLYRAARLGHGTILSNGYYIDLMEPAGRHYLNDPLPPDAALPEAVAARILGGEATMWSELVTPLTVDSRIWPRTAAIAERLWSPADVNDVESMYRRLAGISRYLEGVGATHLRNRAVLLRQLAGQAEIAPLERFVELIEPLKGYERNKEGTLYTRHSPLTLIADAATADAPAARRFGPAVEWYLAERISFTAAAEIRDHLEGWIAETPALLALIARAPALHEIRPMVVNLRDLAEVGLQALEALETGRPVSPAWVVQAQQVLARARQSHGRTELMVVEAVERLVRAAAGRP